MTRISLVTLLQEHAEFNDSLMRLAAVNAYAEAEYIVAIMMTDLAEIGRVPSEMNWPRPGEVPQTGWPLYVSVLRWCQAGMCLDGR